MPTLIPKTTFSQIKSSPQTWMMILSLFLCVTVTTWALKYAYKVADDATAEKRECQTANANLIQSILVKNYIIDAIKNPTPKVDSTTATKSDQQ